jgi:glutathione synthase/RimK-type ligase-like ATP-grasp enzyme
MTILILSTVPDVHAQAVLTALAERGARAELIDLAEFPTQLSLSLTFDDGARRFSLRRRGGAALDLEAVKAVWWRRPQPFRPSAELNDTGRRYAVSEAATAFHGLYQSLNAFWINRPERDQVASHKPYQLALAQKIGLEIPPTLMTNDVDEARSFWRLHEGEVVFKQFIALPEAWRETRRLRKEDETYAETIAHAPVIFQRHVPAVADLRITSIDGQFFAAAADLTKIAYQQDVRMNLNVPYTAHDLPRDIIEKLRRLMSELGLVYGAIDFRLTPEGRYVFLEINPAGQFLYIENATRQPIAAALAQALIDGAKRQL